MEVVATFTTNAAWNAIRGVDRLDLLRHLQAGAGFSDTCRSALGYPARCGAPHQVVSSG